MASYWDEESRTARLAELWNEGLAFSSIAAALSAEFGEITRNAVIGRAMRLGLGGRPADGVRVKNPPKPKPPPRVRRTIEPEPEPEPEPQAAAETETQFMIFSPQFREAIGPNPKGGVRLFNLRDFHCRMIVTDGEPFLFCGARVEPGETYCTSCRPTMFQPRQPGRLREPRW